MTFQDCNSYPKHGVYIIKRGGRSYDRTYKQIKKQTNRDYQIDFSRIDGNVEFVHSICILTSQVSTVITSVIQVDLSVLHSPSAVALFERLSLSILLLAYPYPSAAK